MIEIFILIIVFFSFALLFDPDITSAKKRKPRSKPATSDRKTYYD